VREQRGEKARQGACMDEQIGTIDGRKENTNAALPLRPINTM